MKTPNHVKQPALPAASGRSCLAARSIAETTPGRSPACIKPARSAFTLIELLVVITIIAILASIAVPVFQGVLIRAAQTKAGNNAKQIATALRMYAGDHYGYYPSYTLNNGQPTTTTVANSNEAFAQLFPNYIQQEAIFWLPKSAWCSNSPPPETYDAPGTDPNVLTLAPGQNEWAYVLGLNDNCNPGAPLLADGFAGNSGVVSSHVYTADQSAKGGVWKGQKAIVLYTDTSADMVNLSAATTPAYGVVGPNGSGMPGDIFSTANGANGWLGTANVTVNPD